MEAAKLHRLIQRIDEFNTQDPNKVRVEDFEYPCELIYSKHLTEWVQKLNPHPSPALMIASRGQHIGRWLIPRNKYPQDRSGYLRWREELKKFHSNKIVDFMKAESCPVELIEEVEKIILKKDFRNNPDGQTVEDALCLVFFETQFHELRQKTSAEKMREVVKKTWAKMSSHAQGFFTSLNLNADDREFIEQSLRA